MTTIDLQALAQSGSLPTLPATAFEVLRVCQDPEASIDELARALSLDPMLAGKVLQVANSAFYRRGGEVTSLQRASMVIGMRALKVIALGFILAKELPQTGAPAGLDLTSYWQRSIVTGVVARSLGRVAERTLAEEAFLAGLLSDIGKLALSQAVPDAYAPVVQAGQGWPSSEIERQHLGVTAGDAAAVLLRGWGVPELIVAGSVFADGPSQVPTEVPPGAERLLDLVRLARLGSRVLVDTGTAAEHLARFKEEAEARLSIPPDTIDEIADALEPEIRETAGFLSIDLPDGVSYQALLDQARMQMVTLTVDAMVQLEQTTRTVEILERENQELEERAHTDALTGLPNRASLEAFLQQQVALRRRGGGGAGHLGALMIDVDRFKSFNDTFGHLAGDEALRMVGAALAGHVRDSDVLARYGGEEFCLVVAEADAESLRAAGERLRAAVAAVAVDLGPQGVQSVTASFGGACVAGVSAEDAIERLIAAADAELYRAKEQGRNRVLVAPEPI